MGLKEGVEKIPGIFLLHKRCIRCSIYATKRVVKHVVVM